MLGGLYVVNQSTKQWELKYKDTVRAYGYAHLARFSTDNGPNIAPVNNVLT